MKPVDRMLFAVPVLALVAPPVFAQTLESAGPTAPAAVLGAAPGGPGTLDASDDAFGPRPAEELDGPWRGADRAFDEEFGDGRRTLSRFGANLGRSLVGVVSGDNLRPLLMGAAAAGAGSLLDGRTQRYFEERARWPALGRAGQQLGEPRNLALMATALFASGRVSRDARFRAATYDVAQAFVVNGVWTGALKFAVRRERPDGSSRLSFPSGHTSNAFAWATIADHHYGHKLGAPAYAVAGLIGVSRLEKNAHHLSDVLAGAALGWVVGHTVVREDGGAAGGQRRFTLAPTAGPGGRGVGLALHAQF